MPYTWTNTPYFMTTLRQRGSVPEEFTNNQEDCIIVYKDKFKRIHIDQNNKICDQGNGNGICINIMDPGIAEYTELLTYT